MYVAMGRSLVMQRERGSEEPFDDTNELLTGFVYTQRVQVGPLDRLYLTQGVRGRRMRLPSSRIARVSSRMTPNRPAGISTCV